MSVREFADLLHDFGPAVANHLWQSTAFAGVAAALGFALRRNQARARYWIWMAASLKFLVPFALIASAVGSLAPRHVVAPASAVVYTAVDQVSEPFVLPTVPVEILVPVVPPVNWWAIGLGAVWAIGFCAVLTAWCVRWRRVARVVRSAAPVVEGRELAALERIAAGAGVRRPIRMRASVATLEPGVFGLARPVLLWPAAISARLEDEQLDAVLAHEVCHVRRRDNLTAILHMFVEAAFWFHPMVWWMGAQLLAERERACDEAVIALCPQPQVYAESILKVCEFCIESPLACVSGITGADLKRRVVDIMTARVVRRLTLGAKVAITAAATLALAVPVVLGITKILPLYGEITTPAGPLPSMEVATIKPANPEARGKGFRIEGRHIRTINTSFSDLLAYAYDLQSRQMVGLPAWAESDKYEIEGVAPSDQPGDPNWKLMMRKLLADRFGLQFHTGTTEMPVYELHVGKNGPKLGEVQTGSGQGSLYLSPASHGLGVTLHATGQTMAGLAKLLEGTEFDRPVVDRTGIAGKYDFEMTFSSDRARKGGGAAPPMEDEPNAPPGIFTAIQEQLGLKLEPAKGPAETLVIDKVQKPELDTATPAASVVAPAQAAQPNAIAMTQERLHFDVVSIRPADPNLPQGSGLRFTDDGFQAFGMPLEALVRYAYRLGFVESAVQGVPDWARSGNWDIQARVADADVPEYRGFVHDFTAAGEARRYGIVRNLLADEFKLKAHSATKEGTVYALVGGNGRPKLEKGDDNGQPSMFLRPRGHLQAKNVMLGSITGALAQEIGHPVVDQTGLTQRYNFTLNWAPDRGASSPEQATAPDALPSIFTVVQEQLGLKLEAQKRTVEYLVIDSAAKPSIDGGQAAQLTKPTVGAHADGGMPESAAKLMTVALSQPTSTRPANEAAPLVFEVASIKPNKSVSQNMSLNRTPGGGLEMVNGTIRTLVKFAYGVSDYQLSGAPGWFETEHYDVIAKAPAGTTISNPDKPWLVAADDPVRLRIQALLAERFHLVLHRESKEMPVLALMQEKGGAKLQPWKEGDLPGPSMRGTYTGLTCRKFTMERFATGILSERFGTSVIDRTGLTGEYNFAMTFQPDSTAASNSGPTAPTFLEALHDQLGLKLEKQKGTVEVLAIDRVEKPDPN